MARPKLTVAPDYQRYDCHTNGRCCRGYFEVAISAAEKERIEAQGWPAELGDDPPLFRPRGDGWVLGHHPDGACVFLNEAGLCCIHARFGEPTKPLACRLYPFVFVPCGDEIRVDVRFDCPSSAAGLGRAASQHQAYLKTLLPLAAEGKQLTGEPPEFAPGEVLEWPQLKAVNAAVERLLADISVGLTRRVLACCLLATLLRSAPLRSLRGGDLDRYLRVLGQEALRMALEAPLDAVPPKRLPQTVFRQLVALYGRADRAGEPPRPGRRLLAALRFVVGRGRVPALQDHFPAVTFAAVAGVNGALPQPAEAAVTRYFRVRVHSLGFCGPGFYGGSYVDGLDALLLLYPVLLWYARLFAAGSGRSAPDAADVFAALQVVDHSHGRNPLLNTAAERRRRETLCQLATLGSLVVWLGAPEPAPAGEPTAAES